jgi:RimJ/RimL family protein N-acetyltransferase
VSRGAVVAETERLALRELAKSDDAFVLELVNEPDWIRFIGDKNVRTLEDARRYLREGPIAMYAKHGFGLWAVETKAERVPAGICGLIRRPELEDVDLGFAFLARFRGKGYAREAAAACVEIARERFGLSRLLAITDPENERSMRVLERVGFAFERRWRKGPDAEELALFVHSLSA